MARGSIYRRGHTWSIRYDAGFDDEGRRVQPSEHGFTTRQDAQTRLAKRLVEVGEGRHVQQSRDTLGGYAQHWLDDIITGTVRPRSLAIYTQEVTRYIIPALGTHRLQAVTSAHVTRAYRVWGERGLSPSTISHLRGRLAQIGHAAVREHLLARNTLAEAKAPRVPRGEMRVWTVEQLACFLRSMPEEPIWSMLWHLYAMTGMRRAEAVGLRWRDIDLDRGLIHVRRQASRTGIHVTLEELKTSASERTIAVGPETIALLRAHRSQQVQAQLAAPAWSALDLVFARQRALYGRGAGTAWSPETVTTRWAAVMKTSPVPAIRLHDLRHTHATHLLRLDGNIKAIAARLGHDPVVLLRVYAHVLPDDQDRAVRRLDQALADAQSKLVKDAQ